MHTGTLYGIGVGPGDPDLITIKGVKVLNSVDVIFAASSSKNNYSQAVNIISTHLKKDIPINILKFPMTRERKILENAWHHNAKQIIKTLKDGKDAAFLTLGDPLTYSTFGYIMKSIKSLYSEAVIKIIPGITAFNAATACIKRELVEAEESFAVVSGACGPEKLKNVIEHVDSVVVLKVYRKYREILSVIDEMGLSSASVLVSNCTTDREMIVNDLNEGVDFQPGYFSLLLIRKKWLNE